MGAVTDAAVMVADTVVVGVIAILADGTAMITVVGTSVATTKDSAADGAVACAATAADDFSSAQCSSVSIRRQDKKK
jgi:hypothetical protein